MSLTAQQITVSISLSDADNSASLVRVRLPASTGVNAAMAATEALIAVLLPLTDARIARYSVSYQLREDSTIVPLSALPTPILAQFTFELASDSSQFLTMTIPLDESWLQTSGPLAGFAVDLTNLEVASFTTEMSDGVWVDQFAQDIGPVVGGFRTEAT